MLATIKSNSLVVLALVFTRKTKEKKKKKIEWLSHRSKQKLYSQKHNLKSTVAACSYAEPVRETEQSVKRKKKKQQQQPNCFLKIKTTLKRKK